MRPKNLLKINVITLVPIKIKYNLMHKIRLIFYPKDKYDK
jgi:hypothetical protein